MITTSTGQQFANVQEAKLFLRGLIAARDASIAAQDAAIFNIELTIKYHEEMSAKPMLRAIK